MKRLLVLAVALLLELAGPAHAVPPAEAPAIYVLIALDGANVPVDAAIVQFDPPVAGSSDSPCTLYWASDGFTQRNGTLRLVQDYGQGGSQLAIFDRTAVPLWNVAPCFYLATMDLLVGEGYNFALWDYSMVLGVPLP